MRSVGDIKELLRRGSRRDCVAACDISCGFRSSLVFKCSLNNCLTAAPLAAAPALADQDQPEARQTRPQRLWVPSAVTPTASDLSAVLMRRAGELGHVWRGG